MTKFAQRPSTSLSTPCKFNSDLFTLGAIFHSFSQRASVIYLGVILRFRMFTLVGSRSGGECDKKVLVTTALVS